MAGGRYFRRKIEAMPFGTVVEDPELLWLFRQHPRFHEKTRGLRVVGFVKRRALGGYALYAVLEDGSEVDWSWRRALGLKGRREDVIQAFRAAVSGDVLAARDRRRLGPLLIAEDGSLLPPGEAHVHHEEEFSRILREFLAREGLRLEDVEVVDSGLGYRLKDGDLEERWRRFHAERARLSLLSREQHRQLHSGG